MSMVNQGRLRRKMEVLGMLQNEWEYFLLWAQDARKPTINPLALNRDSLVLDFAFRPDDGWPSLAAGTSILGGLVASRHQQ